MKIFNHLLWSGFCMALSLAVAAQEPVRIQLSGKKEFEQGEPLFIHFSLYNNTDSVIGLCRRPYVRVYSLTYSLPGDLLRHDENTGEIIPEGGILCDYIPPKYEVYKRGPKRCPAGDHTALMIEPGKTLRYSMLINECTDTENYFCKGQYKHLLPRGDYQFDVEFVFTNGLVYAGYHDFGIAGPSPAFRDKLRDFGGLFEAYYWSDGKAVDLSKRYDPALSDPLFDYVLNSGDSLMASKALIQLSDHCGRNEWLLFWYFSLLKKADEKTLWYLLNEMVDREYFPYSDKTGMLRMYDRLLRELKSHRRVYSVYLLERLQARLRYADGNSLRWDQEPLPLEEADLKKLKIYSKKK